MDRFVKNLINVKIVLYMINGRGVYYKMKIAIYCRVSTQDQTTENQRLRLVEHAKRNNWTYEVTEEVMSSRKSRPKKAELLQRLRKKEFDGVLIYKLDRWARSSYELLNEIQELHNKGLCFISLSDNLDLYYGVLGFRLVIRRNS